MLPQYQQSPAFMERFLDAIHEKGKEIERAANRPGIKQVDKIEFQADFFTYFIENKSTMEVEFREELVKKIGEEKTLLFCKTIATDWYDGKGWRNGSRVLGLKLSVKNYLSEIRNVGRKLSEVVVNETIEIDKPLFTSKQIASILTVNDQLMVRHIEAWKDSRIDSRSISNDDIFLRRGLALDRLFNENEKYQEWDYINSYSLAFSTPEKFSQMVSGKIPAIVNGDLNLFDGRILFFSPFVPGMNVGQIEAGVIPGEIPDSIKFQGKHAGICEYVLGDRP